jgi:hypothetical protein
MSSSLNATKKTVVERVGPTAGKEEVNPLPSKNEKFIHVNNIPEPGHFVFVSLIS